jgi:hypothetical protein
MVASMSAVIDASRTVSLMRKTNKNLARSFLVPRLFMRERESTQGAGTSFACVRGPLVKAIIAQREALVAAEARASVARPAAFHIDSVRTWAVPQPQFQGLASYSRHLCVPKTPCVLIW